MYSITIVISGQGSYSPGQMSAIEPQESHSALGSALASLATTLDDSAPPPFETLEALALQSVADLGDFSTSQGGQAIATNLAKWIRDLAGLHCQSGDLQAGQRWLDQALELLPGTAPAAGENIWKSAPERKLRVQLELAREYPEGLVVLTRVHLLEMAKRGAEADSLAISYGADAPDEVRKMFRLSGYRA